MDCPGKVKLSIGHDAWTITDREISSVPLQDDAFKAISGEFVISRYDIKVTDNQYAALHNKMSELSSMYGWKPGETRESRLLIDNQKDVYTPYHSDTCYNVCTLLSEHTDFHMPRLLQYSQVLSNIAVKIEYTTYERNQAMDNLYVVNHQRYGTRWAQATVEIGVLVALGFLAYVPGVYLEKMGIEFKPGRGPRGI